MRRSDEQQHQRCRDAALILTGRFGAEIEHYASQALVDPMELRAWLGKLLFGSGQRADHPVPGLRLETGERSAGPPEMEGVVESHGHQPRAQGKSKGSGKVAPHQVKVKLTSLQKLEKKRADDRERHRLKRVAAQGNAKELSPIQKYWAQFTPEQRIKMMRKRQAKWSSAAKKAWVKKGDRLAAEQDRQARQKIYRARNTAKQRGEPIPPLPSKVEAAA
jgi:hypothetical protein